MQPSDVPVPNLTTAHRGPLNAVEKAILDQVAGIEEWFRQEWRKTPPSLTSSVDLRHSGFKLAPVDTNLFPAGFNNLNSDFLPLCVQAAQAVLNNLSPSCKKILLLPENHTRNQYYMKSLAVFKEILTNAGFVVRIGSLDPELNNPLEVTVDSQKKLLIEPLQRKENKLGIVNFEPCTIILNNDLSTGVPPILLGIKQPIRPTAQLGWTSRLKSNHFAFYKEVSAEFSQLIGLDPWLIDPYFTAVEGIDFMAQEGIERVADAAAELLIAIQRKYKEYDINDEPFVAVKADNGTYGMSVMMVHNAEELRNLNRKQRTRMATSKGSQKVDRVIIQEGIFSFETMPDGAVAEPVVYMIGQYVVGGFYRVHQERGSNENLNAPGMHFEPLAFSQSCNMPRGDLTPSDCPNRFYSYGVIARLAALAAAREIDAIGG